MIMLLEEDVSSRFLPQRFINEGYKLIRYYDNESPWISCYQGTYCLFCPDEKPPKYTSVPSTSTLHRRWDLENIRENLSYIIDEL